MPPPQRKPRGKAHQEDETGGMIQYSGHQPEIKTGGADELSEHSPAILITTRTMGRALHEGCSNAKI